MEEKKTRKKLDKPLVYGGIIAALLVIVSILSNGFGGTLHSLLPVGWFGNNLAAGTEIGYKDAVILGRGVDIDGIYKETIFMQAKDGNYIYAEAVFPEGAWAGAKTKDEIDLEAEGVPLVLMAHGFTGTLNSGGAEELAHLLAEKGIATIRVDFDPRTSPAKKAEKTGFYDLDSMKEALLMGADYMCNSYAIDEDKICLYARSMGGRVAMTMANESYGGYDYKAMALVAPAGNESAMVYYMGGDEKWEQMKKAASSKKLKTEDGLGYVEKQGVYLTYNWFKEFEDYNPCDYGEKFQDKPVLVIYNTLDNVVLPETSIECAESYSNSTLIEVTTEDGHGYEMGIRDSELKVQLMDSITEFFMDALGIEKIEPMEA